MITKRFCFLLSISVMFLCSCAHVVHTSPEEDLLSRVQLEWKSKLEYDWVQAYDLCCGDFKAKMDLNMFLSSSKINVTAFNILDVSIPEPGRGVAIVEYTARHAAWEMNLKSTEAWLLENGEWCLDLSAALAFPMSQ